MKIKIRRIATFCKEIEVPKNAILEEIEEAKQCIVDAWYDLGDDGEWKFEKTEFE